MEQEIQEIAKKLQASAQHYWPEIQRSHRWEFQVLRWCMDDPGLRTQVLRFMDCLPALHEPRQITRHLQEYFPEASGRVPFPLRVGLAATRSGLVTARAAAAVTRQTATAIARLFLAGADIEEAAGPIRRLEAQGFRITLDLLGEATVSEAEADHYLQAYLDAVRRWSSLFSSPIHLSLKLSSLAFPFDPVDPDGAWRRILPRAQPLLQEILDHGGFLNIDMEQFQLREMTLSLTQRLLEEIFPSTSSVGVVVQAYLKDSEACTRRLLDWAARRRGPITVRLVRGAYWDSEVLLSRQREWPCPVYTEKSETDASYERLTDLLLENHSVVRIAVATHNLRSIARAAAQTRRLGVPQERWECQMLFGMSQAMQQAVREAGIPLRIYTPVGDLIPGMAYLVRRILENTSQYSFFAAGLTEGKSIGI